MGKKLVLICSLVFLALLTGCGSWTEEDAKEASRAYLDYYFKGEDENLTKYIKDTTEKELEKEREKGRDSLIKSVFKEDVPVSEKLRTEYGDFYIDLMKKARYTVGDPVKTEEGFEVPVQIEPITSLSDGKYCVLDLQLNEDLSDTELNERIYSTELKRMQELVVDPSYGEPTEAVMHIANSKKGHIFYEEDLSMIGSKAYVIDRHWDSDRVREAAEILVNGIFEEKYDEMAEWTVASVEEIEGFFRSLIGKEHAKELIDESAVNMIRRLDLPETYSCPDHVAEKFAAAIRNLLNGTKHEVTGIDGESDEYIVNVRVTPYDYSGTGDELNRRLSEEEESLTGIKEFIDREYEIYAEILNEKVENDLYAEPVDYQLHLRFNENQMYEPGLDELFKIYNSFVPES